MRISAHRFTPVVLAVTTAVTAGLVLTAPPASAAGITVTDLTAPLSPFNLSRMHTAEATITFRVVSANGQANRPDLLDDTSGIAFAEVPATRLSGDRNDGTWEATVTLGSFMDGTHSARVRVCTSAKSCVVEPLSTDLVVNGSDWPTFGRIKQQPHRLSAGQVSGAVAAGRVVFSASREPVRRISVRLLHHAGDIGHVVDTTHRDGRFTSVWPWAGTAKDSARLALTSSAVPGVRIDGAFLGNPNTRFSVAKPKAPSVVAPGRRLVVRGTVSPGDPASRLGPVQLQVRTDNGWVTRDRADVVPGKSASGSKNVAGYRLSARLVKQGKQVLRVVKPAAMCRGGSCTVAGAKSKPFPVFIGSRAYLVESRLDRLGVPVGAVDGVVDARTRQALCAWRDMTGQKPTRSGLTKKLSRSVMTAKHLPAPHRSDGLYVNKTCQVLFQVVHHKFHRVVWVSSGMPGHETPNGTGAIFRKVSGWVESTLYPGAFMLNPMFFFPDRPAIALHGSASNSLVYPYPASHGCVRTWRPTITQIFNESPIGTKVKVYGHY